MKLCNFVTAEDVAEAANLINVATLRSATDPETGKVDLDMLSTGKSSIIKKKTEEISKNLRKLMSANEAKYINQTSLSKIEEDYNKMFGGDTSVIRD